jgi:hypothetical protein
MRIYVIGNDGIMSREAPATSGTRKNSGARARGAEENRAPFGPEGSAQQLDHPSVV